MDGSADQAVRSGGAGIYIKYTGGGEDHISLATGIYSTNFKAEAVALKIGAEHIEHSPLSSHNIVFFSDAKAVLQALDTARDKELNALSSALASLCRIHTVVLQWVPSHCNILGNDAADSLAKEGSQKEQNDRSTTFKEVKTIIRAKQHNHWLQQHPQHKQNDPYHLLSRPEQVILFRLRTGHNRMNHHLFTKFRIGQSDQCPCQTGSMTTEHLPQFCPLHNGLRHQIWAEETTVQRKLFGSLEDLQRTTAFAQKSGVSI
jgi:ribonuclease HI